MSRDAIDQAVAMMAALRDPERGCPWDLEQSFESIAPYTIEEAYEVAEAIARGDRAALREELGDLLFQVLFHARMAEEQGDFDLADVAATLVEKMVRRHPHVFAGEQVADAAAQSRRWEEHKARERGAAGGASALDGVGGGMPPLRRALELQRRAARVGFDWERPTAVLPKLEEELAELREALVDGDGDPGAELGDLLFTVVNLARHLAVDPDLALAGANAKFERRFRAMERAAKAAREPLAGRSPEALEALWRAAKERD